MAQIRAFKPLILLLCIVFLLRGIVPAGYMPDFESAKSGGFKITLCTAEGPKQITLESHALPDGKPDSGAKKHASPCAFAGVSAPLIGAAMTQFAPPQFTSAHFVFYRETALAAALNLASLPRAPPSA